MEIESVSALISSFGGATRMARAVSDADGVRVLTRDAIYNWKIRNRVPGVWSLAILKAAEDSNIRITIDQLIDFCREEASA